MRIRAKPFREIPIVKILMAFGCAVAAILYFIKRSPRNRVVSPLSADPVRTYDTLYCVLSPFPFPTVFAII